MKYFLLLIVALALVGCGQEQAPLPPEEASPANVQPDANTVKAEQQARKQMAVMTVHEAVQGFKVMQRRYPETLTELIEKGLLPALPDLPPGMIFTYDAEEGAVDVADGTIIE